METYQQAARPLTVTTPLGPDKLLLVGLAGTEALSRLFRFRLELIATNETEVDFARLLGKPLTAHVTAPGGAKRHFSGICCRFAQGNRDATFTAYQADIVPEAWFLTRKAQSRIFQHKAVPEILQEVFKGLKVTPKLKGKYEPRDYCVQYRETDFNFASRLMEEEGIYYLFTHDDGGHTMVLGDTPDTHPEVPFDPQAVFEPLADGTVDEERITEWARAQELRPMKVTLWDHCFEKPHEHLEAEQQIADSVQVGTRTHKLKLGSPEKLELYDWPGEYAQRFDGVDPGGGDRASDLQKIYQDNKRTAEIRMQEEAAGALEIVGAGKLRQLTAGHRFTMTRHHDADGPYVLTAVHHNARLSSDYRSGAADEAVYGNAFTCIPAAVPYRPARQTPKPVVQGTQTAVVVGPKGEELFTDKYGRVKVQFHWDREGKNDEKSSCWIRVAQPIAGKRWGASFWPRIGQEVIVDYLEGDPDQPIVVGSVYNADQMPPYLGEGPDDKHKDDNKVTGFKSNTTAGGAGFNELRFDDTKDKQQIFVHAEKNYDVRVKNDAKHRIYGNHHHIVGWEKDGKKGGDLRERVYEDRHTHVHQDRIEHVEGNLQQLVGKGQAQSGGNVEIVVEKSVKQQIGDGGLHVTVDGDRREKIGGDQILQVAADRHESCTNYHGEGKNEIHLKGGQKIIIESGLEVVIKGGGGFVKIDATGVTIEGTMVKINCGGGPPSPAKPPKIQAPDAPKDASPTDPQVADDAKTGQKSCS